MAPAAGPVAEQAPTAPPPRTWRGRPIGRRTTRLAGVLGMFPFFAYFGAFFLMPTCALLWLAFRTAGLPGEPTFFTLGNLTASLHGVYFVALENSIKLSLTTSVVSALLGLILAWAVVRSQHRWFRETVESVSAVLANFGGIPLVFLFVAVADSTSGAVAVLLHHLGISLRDDLGFDLYSVNGLEVVYLYFMIPLMVLVITPALDGLKPQWREAAMNLGATRSQYLRHVAAPVLAPNLAGAVALLFCSSFSAYATAQALTNGTISLTPIRISTQLSGNVLAGPGQTNLAAALAFDMIAVVLPLTVLYQLMQRRTTKWLR